MKFDLIHADVLEWLASYDGPKYQAILSDPPYALISITKRFGKKDSAPAQEGRDGRFTRLSAGFMGQKWDGFDSLEHYQSWVIEWSKLLIEKALLPGAVCMFFGGTRTYHHLAVGLERGGFEIIDCLMWLYGAGFPKSYDISKGIDKAAGAEREEVGFTQDISHVERGDKNYSGREITSNSQFSKKKVRPITAPATEAAKQWEGHGTSLKPAWEPVVLCRAPRGSMTFAELAKTYGTGGLNIDGARVGTTGGGTHCDNRDEYGKCLGHDNAERSTKGETIHGPEYIAGRWPANLLLSHHEDCVKIGEFEVEGRAINRWVEGMKPFGDAAGEQFESEKLPPEMVERWACVGECPVRQLDDQAGDKIHSAGSARKAKRQADDTGMFSLPGDGHRFGDTGGPSRFFYTSKAGRREKDKGCEHFYWARKEGVFIGISQEEWLKLPRKKRAKANIHPTVKPLDLMRYLSTMILPPDREQERRLLVPFAGSGSEMIGAIQAGWEIVTGIEMETNYVNIAQARYTGNLGLFSLK